MNDLSLHPVLPQWWTDQIASSWQRQREAAVRDWSFARDRSILRDVSIEEHALAFGHGARSAFPHCTRWSAISEQLRADWTRLGNVGPASWEMVFAIIEHEWLRAAGPDGDAASA